MGDRPVRREIKSIGIRDGQPRAPFALPSLSGLKEVIRRAADLGCVTWSRRFQARCRLHHFSTIDAVNIIREGRIVNVPHFDLTRNAWRINLADTVDGFTLVVDVALDCEQDFCVSPRVEIVTAFFRRGPRREVRDWSEEDDQTEEDA
jgi:hypothetical protein